MNPRAIRHRPGRGCSRARPFPLWLGGQEARHPAQSFVGQCFVNSEEGQETSEWTRRLACQQRTIGPLRHETQSQPSLRQSTSSLSLVRAEFLTV